MNYTFASVELVLDYISLKENPAEICKEFRLSSSKDYSEAESSHLEDIAIRSCSFFFLIA